MKTMKGSQENKLSMYLAVQKVCADNDSVWTGLPAFVGSFSAFEAKIAGIESTGQIQTEDKTGIAKDKSVLSDELVKKAIAVSTSVHAFAIDQKNNELLESIDYSRSELAGGRDTELYSKCQIIHDKANAIVGDLGDYGTVAADLADLQSKIDEYGAIIPKPRTAINNKKAATSDLVSHFEEADILLNDKMDKLMEQFGDDDPEFYAIYFNARKIIDLGSSGTGLKGRITDSSTGDRVKHVTVEIPDMERQMKTNGTGL